MIKYNELRIDGDYLYLDVQVEDKPYFANVLIKGARVDTPDTYGTSMPHHIIDEPASTKLVSEVYLPAANKSLLFVTPIIEGTPSPDTPCGKDVNKVGVVYNKKSLLQKGLSYLKELGNSCKIPKGFLDYILRIKALEMSIETCNYTSAIKYWESLNKV